MLPFIIFSLIGGAGPRECAEERLVLYVTVGQPLRVELHRQKKRQQPGRALP